MIRQVKIRQEIEDYLLNKSSADACLEIEKKIFTDNDFYQEFLAVESDLYEKYLDREYLPEEKVLYEEYFLAPPQRRSELLIIQTLREKSRGKGGSPALENQEKSAVWSFKDLFRILVPTFVLLLVVICGVYWWNGSQNSDLEKGLTSLKEAYKNERPLDSRLSEFEYSRFSNTRGAEKKDQTIEISLAEKYLKEAVKGQPSADSYYALGKFYLTQSNFDKALEYFSLAQPKLSNNSNFNNDYGIIYLEKAKSLISDKEKATAEFKKSLEFFNQSLTIRPNAPEVLFNRAKAYQYLGLSEESKADWRKYLEIDSTSKWADEAREQLKNLEQAK